MVLYKNERITLEMDLSFYPNIVTTPSFPVELLISNSD